tara:strand:+ start:240 stop:1100 length:861 start_codon:yes stop_codon:yes gene_type:complete
MKQIDTNQAVGMMVGLAVGDALGASLEFTEAREPANYLREYGTGGIWGVKEGEWTDDTAMAYAMACAIRDRKEFNPYAIMDNFVKWRMQGDFIPRGVCFDIGNTTSRAIEDYMVLPYTPYKGREGERESGNGGLMRIAPAIISATSREMAIAQGIQSTLLTHGSQTCVDYSRAFAEELFMGVPLQKYRNIRLPKDTDRNDVKSGGYVVETYQCAMWSFYNTDNFADCIITAVNRGHDADTSGAVAGMIAGVYYGHDAIPNHFKDKLMWHDKLVEVAQDLHNMEKHN